MPCDFHCCECGAHIITFGADTDHPPEPPLCATCLHLPGWMYVPELREVLGRGMDLPPVSNCGND